MAMAMKGAMVMGTRVVGNKEGDGGSNGDIVGNSNCKEGGGQATATRAMGMATVMMWAMVTVTGWQGI